MQFKKGDLVRTLIADAPLQQVYRIEGFTEGDSGDFLVVMPTDMTGHPYMQAYTEHIRPERVELFAFGKHKIGDKVVVAGENGEWQIRGFMFDDFTVFAHVELIAPPPRKWVPAKRLS